MKILHTSDWHLGHTLYNYDRTLEQQSMLSQIEDIVKAEKPDVFLLCGDVYHTSQPSSAVQTMFTDAIVKLHDANPSMTIVITAGNHDSAAKHDIFRTPWKALKVHVIGNLEKDNLDEHIIEIPGKGYIIGVPYWYERNIPEGFFQSLIDKVKQKNEKNLPVIMTAHTTVSGFDPKGHEKATEYTAGGIDSIELKSLGEGYDYLALGHIHHAQNIKGTDNGVRYSGTPIPVSFDEVYEDCEHSISIVNIVAHGGKPEIRTIDIKNQIPLVTLPSKDKLASWDEAKALLKAFHDDMPAYIRLNVEIEDFLPSGAHEEAHNICKGKKAKFCYINAKRKASENESEEYNSLSISDFQDMDPIEIMRKFAADKNITLDQEMEDLFNEVLIEVEKDKRND